MRKNSLKTWLFRIFFTLASIGILCFIFGNSIAPADKSSADSSKVTDAVQSVARFFAPNSFIATAVGEDYKKLMAWIRTGAHFAEFALMGALFIWCCFSYTKRWYAFLIPILLILYVPLVDECIQLFSVGRAGEVADAIVDTLGGLAGAVFAGLTIGVVVWIGKIRRKRRGKV